MRRETPRSWLAAPRSTFFLFAAMMFPFSSCLGWSGADRATPPMPHPALQRSGVDAARANDTCVSCHAAIADEWRASMHAQAHTDPVYQRALAIEPLPFCRGCHAPEADPRNPPPDELARLGVGCITCHVPEARGAAVLSSPELATEAACSGCHEFEFPAHAPGQPHDKMQATMSEHAASAYATEPCAHCHMPLIGEGDVRHRSHRFSVRAPTVLRAAVVASALRTADGVVVALEPGSVGHAFPTGDLFRRLLVSAEAIGDDWVVLAEASRPLSRRFAWREVGDGHVVRQRVADDRVGVGAEPRTVELSLGDSARGHAIAWRVLYQRVEHPIGGDESGAIVAESIVVADGVLLPETDGLSPERRGP